MPSIRQLEYLVAIEDLEHFGRAAESVHVSQPTLSQQLKEMELRLGVKLVERGRPVRLTPIGREISARARRVMREMAEIRAVAERGRDGMAGTIRLGVSPTIGPYLMPRAVVRLHIDFPKLKLYIREGMPADHYADLHNGRLDMMLAPLPHSGRKLHVKPLFKEPMAMVGAPDHPLFSQKRITMNDFTGEPVLSLDLRHPSHRQTELICDKLGADLLRDYEGTSLDSLRQMAGSGLGLAILPELYLRNETGGEDMVKRFDIEGWSETREIGAIWREGAAFTDSFAAIAEVVAAVAKEILA